MMEIDSRLIASVIGAFATTIAAFISPIVAKRIEQKRQSKFLPTVSLDRKKALNGKWVRYLDQKVGKPEFLIKHKVTAILDYGTNDLSGTMSLNLGDSSRVYETTLINIIFDGRLFKSDYINKESNVVHFGTIYGELSATGKN